MRKQFRQVFFKEYLKCSKVSQHLGDNVKHTSKLVVSMIFQSTSVKSTAHLDYNNCHPGITVPLGFPGSSVHILSVLQVTGEDTETHSRCLTRPTGAKCWYMGELGLEPHPVML